MDRRLRKRIAAYLQRQEAACVSQIEKLDFGTWFSYWHIHPDFRSRANRAPEMVAQLTFTLMRRIEKRYAQQPTPIQVWATICEDTGNNAIFVHSPNPNRDDFPHDFVGVDWTTNVPPELEGCIDSAHEVGAVVYGDEKVYIIRGRA